MKLLFALVLTSPALVPFSLGGGDKIAAASVYPLDSPCLLPSEAQEIRRRDEGRLLPTQCDELSNPLAQAHPMAERLFENLLYGKYSKIRRGPTGEFQKVDLKSPVILPPDNDKDGHPLWFDGRLGMNRLDALVAWLFKSDQFDQLDLLFTDFSRPWQRMADGRWRVLAFNSIFDEYRMKDWDEVHEKIQAWRTKTPRSVAAALAESGYWHSYAWAARGTGYANSVTPEGWALFTDRLKRRKQPYWKASPTPQTTLCGEAD